MTEKRFKTNEVGCIVDYRNNLKNYDGQEIVDLLNELDEKWIEEFSLRETLQLELQRVEEENKQLKAHLSYLEYRFTEYRIKRGDYK